MTHFRSETSLSSSLMTEQVNTKLENTTNRPAIPENKTIKYSETINSNIKTEMLYTSNFEDI